MAHDSFLKQLFAGTLASPQIFPYPELGSAEREHVTALLQTLGAFGKAHIDSPQIDRDAQIPREVIDGLAERGFLGLAIPRRYGGLGLSQSGYARVMQSMAGIDVSVALTAGAHQSLAARAIERFGSEPLKERYLPKLARGEALAAFAITEAGGGSDMNGMHTLAERQGEDFRLRGTKIWTTNGGIADVFVVVARTAASGTSSKPRLTAFVVERGPGVHTGDNEAKLGIRGTSTTDLVLDGAVVGADAVLGEVGRGFRVAAETLNDGRLGLAAGCVGLSKRLIELTVDHLKSRRAFGRTIGEFSLMKDKVARMLSETYALESMVYLTCSFADRNADGEARGQRKGRIDYSLESAACKVFGSEVLWRVAGEALQAAAGRGYMAAYPYERLLRDARVNLIFEGTNEVLRCFIALSGMHAPGRQLDELARAVREPMSSLGTLSQFALQRARSVLTSSKIEGHVPRFDEQATWLAGFADALGKHVERTIWRHGKNVAEMQFTQQRVADIAIDLFAVSACISRASRAIRARGEQGARRELDLTLLFTNTARQRLTRTFAALDDNDDELRKSVAMKAYLDGVYPLDIL